MSEIFLYDDIRAGAAKAFIAELKRAGAGPVAVRINSVGGDVFEGIAALNALKRHKGRVTAHIDGIAASISSVIAMGADEIRIAQNAYVMIHDPAGMVSGGAADMDRMADTLRRVGVTIRDAYRRTKQSDETIAGWMAAETWFTAEEALAAGLVDAIDGPMQMAASIDLSKFASVPLAIAAALGRGPSAKTSGEGNPMDAHEDRPDEAPANDISTLRAAYRSASVLGLGAAEVDGLLDAGVTASALPERLIEIHAQREAARAPKMSHIPIGDRMTNGDADLVDAMVAKLSGQACANRFGRCSFIEIGRELASRRGFNAWGATAEELFSWRNTAPRFSNDGGMMTTGDLPTLTTISGQKYLLQQHELNQSVLLRLARRRDRRDFNAFYNVRLSEAPTLAKVLEAGEVTYGSFTEQGETGTIDSYARIVSLSFKALTNDDVGAFGDIIASLGASAAQLEGDLLLAVLSANSFTGKTMSDGQPLFHTSHANVSGSGGAIDNTTVGAGFLAMRTQRGIGGVSFIDTAPAFLLTGPKQEAVARAYLATIYPTASSGVNTFAGGLQLLVENRLGATNTRWWLFSDPGRVPVLEWGSLENMTAPRLKSEETFDVLGMRWRIEYHIGATAADWRGSYTNAGA